MTKVERKNSLLAEEMTLKYKFLIFPADENSGVYQGFFIFAALGSQVLQYALLAGIMYLYPGKQKKPAIHIEAGIKKSDLVNLKS